MDWTAYAESLSESWIEAQTNLWESWAKMMGSVPAGGKSTASADLLEPWKKPSQQSMEAWIASAAPISKSVAEQFFAVQETALRFLEFSARTWEAVGPKIETGEDWQAAFQESLEQFRKNWVQFPTIAADTTQDLNAQWEIYLKQWQQFGQPWEAVLQQAPEYFGRMIAGDSSALTGLSNLYRDAYQQSLARLVGSPNLGISREFNEKLQLGFDAWVSWQLATMEYQGVLSDIWDQAFDGFKETLLSMAEKGEKVETLRDFVLLWTRGAEKVFTEAFRTETYVLAQGKMLNAGMAYRIRERKIIEEYLKLYDLPTRSELDETHRRIYELRKEVKALKKQLAEVSGSKKGDA
jgi:class III poly(R)-hydroxyalkanoic acid synthase PhaE subunit